jgi:hypothetical protein
MYDLDLLNLQIEVLAGKDNPLFEIAGISDDLILLRDPKAAGRKSVFAHANHVINLLGKLGILGKRKVFCGAEGQRLREMVHVNGRFAFHGDNYLPADAAGNPDLRGTGSIEKSKAVEYEEINRLNGHIRNAVHRSPAANSLFKILKITDIFIYLKDMGLPARYSVTNDAEWVIATLAALGILENRKVFYMDTDTNIDEILHENGKFKDFSFGHEGIDSKEFEV